MKALIFLITHALIGIIITETSAQNNHYTSYYYQLYLADSLSLLEQYDQALICYENSFDKVEYVHTRILNKALKTAKTAKNSSLIRKYKNQIKAQNKCPEENQLLVAQLDSIFEYDQKVRSPKYWNAKQFYKKYRNDGSMNSTAKFIEAKRLQDESVSVDSSNMAFLTNLINENGFLSEQRIGYNHYHKFDAMLLHFDTDMNNEILKPILDKALSNGEILPHFYTRILDRHQYATNKTQTYWTWFIVDKDPALSDKEINKILTLREKIGLYGTSYCVKNYKDSWTIDIGHLFY